MRRVFLSCAVLLLAVAVSHVGINGVLFRWARRQETVSNPCVINLMRTYKKITAVCDGSRPLESESLDRGLINGLEFCHFLLFSLCWFELEEVLQLGADSRWIYLAVLKCEHTSRCLKIVCSDTKLKFSVMPWVCHTFWRLLVSSKP